MSAQEQTGEAEFDGSGNGHRPGLLRVARRRRRLAAALLFACALTAAASAVTIRYFDTGAPAGETAAAAVCALAIFFALCYRALR